MSFMSTRNHVILGIDPGLTGAIAFYYLDSPGGIVVYDIPVADGEVDTDTLAATIKGLAPTMAVIERVGAMPGQGVSSTFKFGTVYGALRAVVSVLQIPQHLVTPAKWKAHFRLSKDKEEARARALQLWPGAGYFARKKDHGRAEAALIALYGAEVICNPHTTTSPRRGGGVATGGGVVASAQPPNTVQPGAGDPSV
jgi:hypothetical protein